MWLSTSVQEHDVINQVHSQVQKVHSPNFLLGELYNWCSENIASIIIFHSWISSEKPSSSFCVMLYFWWGCWKKLKLIILGSARDWTFDFCAPCFARSPLEFYSSFKALPYGTSEQTEQLLATVGDTFCAIQFTQDPRSFRSGTTTTGTHQISRVTKRYIFKCERGACGYLHPGKNS